MNICGERVILRAVELHDSAMFLELINDPETERMLGGGSYPVSEAAQIKWIGEQQERRDILRCVIADKESVEDGFGTVILSDIDTKNGVAQVHIKMTAGSRGKGYGSDALKTIVKYAFRQLRLHCVFAQVLEYNGVSRRVFEKCGFRNEGRLRARAYKDGTYVDVFSYSILNDEI